ARKQLSFCGETGSGVGVPEHDPVTGMPGNRQEWRKARRWSARDTQGEAATLIAELDALFADLLDPKPAFDRVALAIAPAVDEDHALRRRVGIDQRLEPERRRLGRRRRSRGGSWRRRGLDRRGPGARTRGRPRRRRGAPRARRGAPR